jgi:hypothetical protein
MLLAFNHLNQLIHSEEDEYALVHWMKSLVPEFLSNNSEFEALDGVNEKEKMDIYAPNGLDSK